jgi:hypothetical protein
MIKYKRNIIDMMAKKGVTTYIIRKNKLFTESQLQQLRNDRLVTQDTLDKCQHKKGTPENPEP